MPEKGLEFQIDFESQQFLMDLEIFILNTKHKKFW